MAINKDKDTILQLLSIIFEQANLIESIAKKNPTIDNRIKFCANAIKSTVSSVESKIKKIE